jgi:hypothetical protein
VNVCRYWGNINNLTPFRQQQAKKIIFVFLVLTLVSSLSASAFLTGNAFAKKSSNSDGGGSKDKGGSSSDNGGGGGSSKDKGGSSSDNGDGGGSSDTSGGGSSDNTGGGTTTGGSDTGGGSSDTGSTSTSPSTTAEPPTTEGSTSPPPPAENQQTACPNGLTADEKGNCPSSTDSTTPPAPVDCKANPTDPSCTAANTTPAPVDCKANPTDPSCTNTANTLAPVDCTKNPTDPSCTTTTTPPVKCAADEYLQSTVGVCFSAKVVDPVTHQCGLAGYHKISDGSCESDDFQLPISMGGGCIAGRHLNILHQCVMDNAPTSATTTNTGTTGTGTAPMQTGGTNTGGSTGTTNTQTAQTNNAGTMPFPPDIPTLPGGGCPSAYHSQGGTSNCKSDYIPISDGNGKTTCVTGRHIAPNSEKHVYECVPDNPPTSTAGTGGTTTNTGGATTGNTPMQTGGTTTGTGTGGTATPAPAGGNNPVEITVEYPTGEDGSCPAGLEDVGVACIQKIQSTNGLCPSGTTASPSVHGECKSDSPFTGKTQTTQTSTGGAASTPITTTGNPTTPTTTTTSPTSTSTTATTTTNVINRGGSSTTGGGASGSAATATPAQGSNTFLTYVNAVNKITIKYPSTWTKTELVGNPSIPVMFSAPVASATGTPNTAKTSFVISITPGASSLDSFTQQQLSTLTQSQAIKYTITDPNAKLLTPPTGITAFREVSYDAMKANIPLKGAAIFFVNGGTGYSLLYLAKQTEYTQNIPMVQQMVNSFQVGAVGGSNGGANVQNVAAASSSSR